MTTAILYILIAIVVAYTPLFLFDRWSRSRRLKAIQDVAVRLNGTYLAKDEREIVKRMAAFPLMQRGKDGTCVNLIQVDAHTWLFEYIYRVRGQARHNRRYQTGILIQKAGQLWPEFQLSPPGLIAAVRTGFGLRGSEVIETIDIPGQDAFNKLYNLTGKHPDLITPYFNDKVVAAFMDKPGASLEANGDKLLFYFDQKRLEPKELEDFFEQTLARAELFVVDVDDLGSEVAGV